jgi:hypothetical protein
MTSRRYTHSNPGKRRLRHLPAILPAIGLVMSMTLPVQSVQGSTRSAASAPRPGAWTQLGTAQGGTTPTLIHVANGNDLVVWMAPGASGKYHYDSVELKPTGGMASKPTDVFGGQDWDGLTFTPILVSDGGQPLLIFEGGRDTIGTDPYSRGCIVGDLLTPSGWQLQSWSLSADCLLDHIGTTVTQNGTLAAAWPGGWSNGNGILYRIGVSSSIPATAADQQISTRVGDAGSVGAATDMGNQDAYAAWTRFFSKPATQDGLWAADLTKGSAPLKAPDTGTNLVASFPEPVAIAGPTGRSGIYLAYCNNASPCSRVELWRYGDKTAKTVPKSTSPRSVALSAGPSGRLWIAWWSSKNGTVRVVRTNEAGNAFGPVETHAGPHGCTSDGNGTIKLSSGSQQRLDVAMSCYDYISAHGAVHASATQSLVPLQVAATTVSVNRKQGGSVTYRVSDVGDAVVGATVTVDGKKGTTNKKGQITFHFPKGSRTGSFKVIATMANYLGASTSLQIR